jgi:hypothetical protein
MELTNLEGFFIKILTIQLYHLSYLLGGLSQNNSSQDNYF